MIGKTAGDCGGGRRGEAPPAGATGRRFRETTDGSRSFASAMDVVEVVAGIGIPLVAVIVTWRVVRRWHRSQSDEDDYEGW